MLTCGALGAITYAAQVVSDGTPRWTLAIVLALASAALFVAGTWHLLRTPAPLINLRTLRIPTFGAAISGSSMFWLVVGAIPFLLPLLFQTVFGWSAIKSGSVVLFVFVGNIAIKPATTWLFNRFGFRTDAAGGHDRPGRDGRRRGPAHGRHAGGRRRPRGGAERRRALGRAHRLHDARASATSRRS